MKMYKVPYKFLKTKYKSNDLLLMKDVITKDFKSSDLLSFPLGKDEQNNIVYLDLNEINHLLVSGISGSGKSSLLHVIINSLLLKNSPEQLKLLLVDPKRCEFQEYDNIPHLATPIIMDSIHIVKALKWLLEEMERRRGLKDCSLLPKIILLMDEYADCVREYRESLDLLTRLIQFGSDVGIHLVLCTAQIDINTITGTLKAYIPTRIAFKTTTSFESKVIIDQSDAENLSNRGKMIIKKDDTYIHAQGAYIMPSNIVKICDYLSKHYDSIFLISKEDLEQYEIQSNIETEYHEDEDLLYEIASYCIEIQKPTINTIQSTFGIGFNRATRILNELENKKIITPKQGLQGRSVLVDKETLDKMFHK